jgi:hypothetical protein
VSATTGGFEVPRVFRNKTAQADLDDRVENIEDAEHEEDPAYIAELADVELALQDIETGLGFDSRGEREDARRWLISVGVYRYITEAALAERVEYCRGRERVGRADFRLDGKAYIFEQHLPRRSGGSFPAGVGGS